jgi:hypothetical protein
MFELPNDFERFLIPTSTPPIESPPGTVSDIAAAIGRGSISRGAPNDGAGPRRVGHHSDNDGGEGRLLEG